MNPPLLFRIAKRMERANLRGSYRLLQVAESLGQLNKTVEYQLPNGVKISVPLWLNRWSRADVLQYSHAEVHSLARAIREIQDVTFFDCGADIGTVSCLVQSFSLTLKKIYAFEPNLDVYSILSDNLSGLGIEVHSYACAVGAKEGWGSLKSPSYDDTAHGRFMSEGPGGIRIMTIDSLGCKDPKIAIKIDTEGTELEVIQGATETIRQAKYAVVSFEAHPLVAKRTGRLPSLCVEALRKIRPFHFRIAETRAPLLAGEPIPNWQSNVNILAVSCHA